jgi:uncharacterized membrane protein YebE (DUF533 family)
MSKSYIKRFGWISRQPRSETKYLSMLRARVRLQDQLYEDRIVLSTDSDCKNA